VLTEKQKRKTVWTAEGHLLWQGGLANGYPAIKEGSRTVYLKRVVWEETQGPVPEGAVVVSSCGKRACIEAAHLALARPGRYPQLIARPATDPDS
jgi:HNH endonuclease